MGFLRTGVVIFSSPGWGLTLAGVIGWSVGRLVGQAGVGSMSGL